MGLVVVVSLPLILLVLIIALAAYLLGRARGRGQRAPQYYGGPPVPAPPFQGHSPDAGKPSNV